MTQDPLFLVSVNLFAAVMLRCIKPNVFSALILTVVMIASAAYLGTKQGDVILGSMYQARDLAYARFGKQPDWPPVKDREYPDLQLRDHQGRQVRLSEFRGKVILIEPVGMSCPACVAFSGGQQFGPFRGVNPQPNLEAIENYAESFGEIRLDHPDVVFIQLLLFNQQLEAPTSEEVAAWAIHFGKASKNNCLVLGGTPALANTASQALVPGFQLIDKKFVLRIDSTGEKPADDLYRKLLPSIRKLLDE
jgi:hypothetical protein